MRIIATLFLTISSFFAFSMDQNLEEQKIQYLLDSIEKSSLVFIRNGKEHSAKEAKKHLENKMNYARRAFWLFGPKADITVDNFIEKIGSKSSTSGEIYKVRTSKGQVIPTNEWLRMTLKSFKSTHSRPLKK